MGALSMTQISAQSEASTKKSCAKSCAKTCMKSDAKADAAAAKAASMVDNIERKECADGSVCYVRKDIDEQTGEVINTQVKYDAATASFVALSKNDKKCSAKEMKACHGKSAKKCSAECKKACCSDKAKASGASTRVINIHETKEVATKHAELQEQKN